jgi:hypothetical protein
VNPLREAAEAALVEVTGAASVVRQCGHCGSLDHGQPILVGSDLHVSIAYADELAAIAWGEEPVGIDVERTDATTPFSATVTEWTHLEALGKAAGTGLREWPDVIPPERPARSLEMPKGYVGTLAGDALGWTTVTLA